MADQGQDGAETRRTANCNRYDAILADITSNYTSEVATGELLMARKVALAVTLMRLDDKIYQELKKRKFDNMSMDSLYLYGITTSKFDQPYIDLNGATGKLRSPHDQSSLAWSDINLIYFPKKEQYMASSKWELLHILMEKYKLLPRVKYDLVFNRDIDPLENDKNLTGSYVHEVFVRLMELMRNPLSATFCRTNLDNQKVRARNDIDFIALDLIFSRKIDKMEGLTISPLIASYGRRKESVTVSHNGKEIKKDYYVGYTLARQLSYQQGMAEKLKMEKHYLFAAVYAILEEIVKSIPENQIESYKMNKSFVEHPSVNLHGKLRFGPKSKREEDHGKRIVYTPFTFYKSKGFDLYPGSLKTNLCTSSGHVMNTIMKCNNRTLEDSVPCIKSIESVIKEAYNISDDMKKRWFSACDIPHMLASRNALCEMEEEMSKQYAPPPKRESTVEIANLSAEAQEEIEEKAAKQKSLDHEKYFNLPRFLSKCENAKGKLEAITFHSHFNDDERTDREVKAIQELFSKSKTAAKAGKSKNKDEDKWEMPERYSPPSRGRGKR